MLVAAGKKEIKLALIQKEKTPAGFALAIEDFAGFALPGLHPEVKGVGFLRIEVVVQRGEKLDMPVVQGAALGRLDDLGRLDNFHQGHVIHGHQPLPQGFGLGKMTRPGLRLDQFDQQLDGSGFVVGADESIDFLFHLVEIFHGLGLPRV